MDASRAVDSVIAAVHQANEALDSAVTGMGEYQENREESRANPRYTNFSLKRVYRLRYHARVSNTLVFPRLGLETRRLSVEKHDLLPTLFSQLPRPGYSTRLSKFSVFFALVLRARKI